MGQECSSTTTLEPVISKLLNRGGGHTRSSTTSHTPLCHDQRLVRTSC